MEKQTKFCAFLTMKNMIILLEFLENMCYNMVRLEHKSDKGAMMMVVKCNSVGLFGLKTYAIEIEADLSRGVGAFDIVACAAP